MTCGVKTPAAAGQATPAFGLGRPLACLAVLAAWALLGGPARAQYQPTPDQEMPPKTYMSKNVFYLPVKIDDRARASLREVQLYVKDNPSRPWMLNQRATPRQTYFTFRPPHDGEYWFTVVTVDNKNRLTPADIRMEPPAVIVVQDTVKPNVEVRALPGISEGTCVYCAVRDANPDLTKTRFFYQTRDQVWRPLAAMPGQPTQYCIPAQAMFTGMVRVEAADLAGNSVNREFNLGASHMAGATPPESMLATGGLAPNCCVPTGESPEPAKTPGMKTQAVAAKVAPSISPDCEPAADPVSERAGPELNPAVQNIVNTSHKSKTAPVARTPRTPAPVAATPLENAPEDPPAQAPSLSKSIAAAKQLVNKTHVFLQYQIDDAGPSGVGKVEIWLTRDQGQTWKKIGEDQDCKSPVEIDLPGEGLFGVSMVVSNGRGFGATPPTAGDTPDWLIEVDTTKPAAELVVVEPGDAATVTINWKAQDKNLASQPIDLSYAQAREGPWQAIAKGLKNDGQYRWQVPANVSEVYVRLVARDAAGNVTITETPQPVTLDDMSRPRGRVIGVTTVPPRSAN